MKNLLYFISIFVFTTYSNAQIVDLSLPGNDKFSKPAGYYMKDLSNTFGVFLGTWTYQNGNEILTIKLEKSEDFKNVTYGNFRDYIKGNYSLSLDGGATYVTNTIANNFSNDPDLNTLWSLGPLDQKELHVVFRDKGYNKSCKLLLTFLPNSTTQLKFHLYHSGGYMYPAVPPANVFSVPNNIILTKQP